MKSVAFFNNKGGVGKTTLVSNVASHFALALDLRVLLVDCDPQCNATQLLLDEETCNSLYWDPKPGNKPTVLDTLRPLEEGDASIATDIQPWTGTSNRFGVDLLPGHPRLSVIEDILSRAWNDGLGGDIGGIRRSNWVTLLTRRYADEYQFLVA